MHLTLLGATPSPSIDLMRAMRHHLGVHHAVIERFTLSVTVGSTDIDELDHVSNLVYVRWVLDAARAHSDACGYDHAAYRELDGIFQVRRHEVDYLAAARLGDALHVTTWVHSWKGVSCHRGTDVTRVADGKRLAAADTTWVFVGFTSGRPTRIPAELRRVFGAPTGS